MLTPNAQGRAVVGGRWTGWPFIDGTFDAPHATLEGIVCPTLSIEGLIDSNASYADQTPGAPPMRAREVSDVANLRALLGEQGQPS